MVYVPASGTVLEPFGCNELCLFPESGGFLVCINFYTLTVRWRVRMIKAFKVTLQFFLQFLLAYVQLLVMYFGDENWWDSNVRIENTCESLSSRDRNVEFTSSFAALPALLSSWPSISSILWCLLPSFDRLVHFYLLIGIAPWLALRCLYSTAMMPWLLSGILRGSCSDPRMFCSAVRSMNLRRFFLICVLGSTARAYWNMVISSCYK